MSRSRYIKMYFSTGKSVIPYRGRGGYTKYKNILLSFSFGVGISAVTFIIIYCVFLIDNRLVEPGFNFGDDRIAHTFENNAVSTEMYDEVKVLCWIMTSPSNHQKKAQHAVKTWGKRCNKLLVMSSQTDEDLDVVALPVQEGRNKLWAKTKEAFKYIYEHHLDDADWFLKADDDTYVVMENLRYLLYPYPPDYPLYFGYRFKVLPDSGFVPQGYMAGGPGYVLSKKAVRELVEIALPNKGLCRQDDGGPEDLELGKCLTNINVPTIDSQKTRSRAWFWQMAYYQFNGGLECCSDNAISFHYQSPKDMYLLEYLIYHLRPFGVKFDQRKPAKLSVEQVKQMVLSQEPEWDLT